MSCHGQTRRLLIAAFSALLIVTLAPSGASAWTEKEQTPQAVLSSGLSQLDAPQGIAIDRQGWLFVVSTRSNSVTAYRPSGAGFDPAPAKVLKGKRTGIVNPRGIAFDASGRMYVVNSDSVTAYSPDWESGDTAPVKSLRGPDAGLVEPVGIAFDSADRMYVVNSFEYRGGAGNVTVYAPDWPSGDTRPVATLVGVSTGLDYPLGIAFDSAGLMYVSNRSSVTAYSLGWLGGNLAPVATLAGSATRLSRPTGITFDDEGFMIVANFGGGANSSLTIFPPDWARGNTGQSIGETQRVQQSGIPPTGVVVGGLTGLNGPHGVGVNEAGSVFVANQEGSSVTGYSLALQRVLIEAPAGLPLISQQFAYSARSTSGLPVTVTSATPTICRITDPVDGIVELLTVGQCLLEGRQYGDDYWARAPVTKHYVLVGPTSQTITFDPPPQVTMTQRILRLEGAASSGLPVVWTTRTPEVCKAQGKFGQRLRLLAPGSCFVDANQPGNAHWQAAPTVNRVISIVRGTP